MASFFVVSGNAKIIGGVGGELVGAVNFCACSFLFCCADGCRAPSFTNVEQVAFAGDGIDCTRFVHGGRGWASFEKVGAKGRGGGENGINVEFVS